MIYRADRLAVLLLARGARRGLKNRRGQTALDLARKRKDRAMIEVLRGRAP